MAKKVLVNLDLTKNQVLNIALHNLASAPSSPVQGQIYYNTTDKAVYYWDGTSWISVSGDITEVIAGNGLIGGGNTGAVTLDLNPDNSTIEVSSDIVRIKDLGVTTAKLADASVTTLKIADNNVTFAKIQDIATMTVIGRVSAGSGDPESITVINDNTLATATATNLATAGSIKAYVDNRIASLGNLEGGFAAGSSTNFPASAGGTKAGDYWYVTSAGTVQGVILNIGDVLIAAIDAASPTVATNWIFLESNRDQATETVKGVAEIATQVETNTGTDDERIVTPLKLKTYLDNRTGGYAANIGNASATSFVVNHALNAIDVVVAVKDNTTLEIVITDVVITDSNNVTVSFATAPALNAYRVIVKK
jgi:hypothetical protein